MEQPGKKKRLMWAKHQQRWFGKWHLYLGIIAGAIVAFVGVTGSILVFDDEIDEALNRELFEVAAQQQKIPLGEMVTIVRTKYPDLKFDYIEGDDDAPNATYHLYNFKKEEQYFINPYTGDMSGKRLYESGFIHIVTDLHRTLLIPVAGRYIVGLAALILLILTISGLRLWIPDKWKQLKSVLTIDFKAGFKRQNYDWHNTVGFYSAPVVSLLSLTGVCITFSVLVVPLLFILSGKSPQGVAQLLGAKSVYTAGAQPLDAAKIVQIAESTMPGSHARGIAMPVDSTGNYRIDLRGTKLPRNGNREMIIIDQYSGKVLTNSRIDFPDVGNAYLSWLTPVHFGDFGGMPTRIVALLGGLMPLVLFVTGFIIWWPRYKKQKKNGKQEKVKPVEAPSPSFRYFVTNLKKGFKYAGWLLLIGMVMGALYGLISGIVLQPAIFTMMFATVLVVLNFVVAFIVFLVNTVFLLPFRKGSRGVLRYFALSLSFLLVYMAVYLLFAKTGVRFF